MWWCVSYLGVSRAAYIERNLKIKVWCNLLVRTRHVRRIFATKTFVSRIPQCVLTKTWVASRRHSYFLRFIKISIWETWDSMVRWWKLVCIECDTSIWNYAVCGSKYTSQSSCWLGGGEVTIGSSAMKFRTKIWCSGNCSRWLQWRRERTILRLNERNCVSKRVRRWWYYIIC